MLNLCEQLNMICAHMHEHDIIIYSYIYMHKPETLISEGVSTMVLVQKPLLILLYVCYWRDYQQRFIL
jgi:hypothetical protein